MKKISANLMRKIEAKLIYNGFKAPFKFAQNDMFGYPELNYSYKVVNEPYDEYSGLIKIMDNTDNTFSYLREEEALDFYKKIQELENGYDYDEEKIQLFLHEYKDRMHSGGKLEYSGDQYDYSFDGIGLTIKNLRTGKDVYLQGEEGSRLYDELEEVDDPGTVQYMLSQYEEVMD